MNILYYILESGRRGVIEQRTHGINTQSFPPGMFHSTIFNGYQGPTRFWERWEGAIGSAECSAFILSQIQIYSALEYIRLD